MKKGRDHALETASGRNNFGLLSAFSRLGDLQPLGTGCNHGLHKGSTLCCPRRLRSRCRGSAAGCHKFGRFWRPAVIGRGALVAQAGLLELERRGRRAELQVRRAVDPKYQRTSWRASSETT
jgi:hypothetical protein